MRAKTFEDFYRPAYDREFKKISAEEQARNPGKVAKQSTSKTALKQKQLAALIGMRAQAGKDIYADVGRRTDPNSQADLIRNSVGYKDPLQASIESLRKKRMIQLYKSGELKNYVGQRARFGVDPFKTGAVEDSALQDELDYIRLNSLDNERAKEDEFMRLVRETRS